MTRSTLIALLAVTLCGCGTHAVQDEDVKEVKQSASLVGSAAHALQILGILPSYECGEPRRNFLGRLTSGHHFNEGCVATATSAQGEMADMLTLQFEEGCAIGEKDLRGTARGYLSGGDDRIALSLDMNDVTVGGDKLPASVGFEKCGDEDRYSAFVQARISRETERWFELEATVAKRDGIFLIGKDTLVLEGHGKVTHPAGTDQVSFDELTYELGQLMPWDGSLEVETSDGRSVRAEFDSDGMPYRTGHLSVQVDEGKVVRVPVVR